MTPPTPHHTRPALRSAAGRRAARLVAWSVALAGGLWVLQHASPPSHADDAVTTAAARVLGVLRVGGLVVGWYLVAVTVAGVLARLADAHSVVAHSVVAAVDHVSVGAVRRLLDMAMGVSVAAATLVPVAGTATAAAADTHGPAAASGTHGPPATIRRMPDDEGAEAPDRVPSAEPTENAEGGGESPVPPPTQPPDEGGPSDRDDTVPPAVTDDPEAVLRELRTLDTGTDTEPDAGSDTDAGTARSSAPTTTPSAAPAEAGARPRTNPAAPASSVPASSPEAVVPEPRSSSRAGPGDDDGVAPLSSASPPPGPHSRPAPAPRPGLAPVASTRTHVVQPGDHFWSIAARVLAEAWGRPPTDHEIAPYWRGLVEANVDRLVHRHDPDLVFPGQTFVVPDPPAPPPVAETARPP